MKFIDLQTQHQQIAQDVDQRIAAVHKHGQYILGPEVFELEAQLANFVGVKHCVTCSDGTRGLMLAMMALDIQPGDEIITTPFTFFATVEMILMLGATPVFVDIDPQTYNIDPNKIAEVISPKTKAILAVSLYGQTANLTAINQIAAQHNLTVIEDGAQSFGATHHSARSCSLTTIATTSFFPAKPLGCYGDGGACFTNDADLAERLRQLRDHGQAGRYHHIRIGVNSRLDTIQAAVLIAKLDIFSAEISARQKVANRYRELLPATVKLPYIEPENRSVYAQYTIRVQQRDEFCAAMKEQGIPTSVHYPLAVNQQPALKQYPFSSYRFPHTECAAKEVVSLPMHPYLTREQQALVASSMSKDDILV